MKIKNSLLFATGSCLLFLAACQSPRDQLVKKWQVESFDIPMRDSMRRAHEKSIDTLSHMDSAIAQNFGTSSIDSVKAILRQQIEEEKKMEADAAKQTSFDFRKDSLLIINNGAVADSAIWKLSDDSKKLTFTPVSSKGSEQAFTFDVVSLSKEKLQLKLKQGSSVMQVNLRPYTKEDSVAAAKIMQEQLEEQLARQKQIQQMQQQMQQQNGSQPQQGAGQ